jgi:solute carrier family 7 (L-type amino acid transporter), member 9/15
MVASEIKDPGRSLPKAIKAAMTVVLSCYEFVNIAYYILLPWNTMSSSNAVAVEAAKALLGRSAGVLVTLLVAISCAGSITSNIFSVGRLIIAAAQRHYLPTSLARRGLPRLLQKQSVEISQSQVEGTEDTNFDAPMYTPHYICYTTTNMLSNANCLSTVITLLYIVSGSFRALLTFVGMAEWVFYVSTVIGLIILRRREPELPRPYRPNLVLPVVFVAVGTLIIIRSAMFAPIQSGVLAGLLVAGTLVSNLRRR